MKENEKELDELSDENLKATSGGTGSFDKIYPNVIKIHNNPQDIFPKNRLEQILKNYKKDK